MPAKTIAELVNEARLGSAESRDELVRRHFRETAILATALVNDPTEAEDLSQEAFIRAFRNLDLLVDPNRFGPWLRRIVFGVSIDWLRRFRPDLYRGWDGTDETFSAAPDLSPLEHLLRSEMGARISAALDALPARYRVPIRLYHLDGLSHARIASDLGIPVATVRSLVARARRKLAPLLAEYAPEALLRTQEVLEEHSVTLSQPFRCLHVANGTCTTRIIEAAGIPGTVSIWADPLYEGPVPGGLTDEELMEVRATYLAPADGVPADPVNDMRLWRSTIANHQSYDELVLWFEHDLFDQLNLIQVLSWIRHRLPSAKAVSLVCIGAFPGYPRFKGLGALRPDDLASLLETRLRLTDAQYDLAERAWHAFREPTPEALDDLRRSDTPALPFLSAAIARFLAEYPSTTDGLSRTERRLLQIAEWPVGLSAAFSRMHEGEDVYYITDTAFEALVDRMSSSAIPLLTLQQDLMTLTDAGREVLQGKREWRAGGGQDRWLGGVRLQGDAPEWRWDDRDERMSRG